MAVRHSIPGLARLCVTAALFAWTSGAAPAQLRPWPAGDVRFYNVADSSFAPHLENATPQERAWMVAHYKRMQAYSPAFDEELSWYPRALAYVDAYGIKPSWAVFAQKPEWILKGSNGKQLYIPWGCSGGNCPQYAADFGNPEYRSWWIGEARKLLDKGYLGLRIDDVNMTWRVSDGNGNHVTPVDPRTGQLMTLTDWRRYMAEFVEAVRASFPAAEIVHNVVWYAAPVSDPFQKRQIDAADMLTLDRGVNDKGLVGGTKTFGLETFLSFVDFVHGRGTPVVFMDVGKTLQQREYGLAGWLLISQGLDMFYTHELAWTTPQTWWPGFSLKLGNALGQRATWKGLIRRDFRRGMVLFNQPGQPTIGVQLPGPFVDLTGKTVFSVTLKEKQAAILLRK